MKVPTEMARSYRFQGKRQKGFPGVEASPKSLKTSSPGGGYQHDGPGNPPAGAELGPEEAQRWVLCGEEVREDLVGESETACAMPRGKRTTQ